MGTRIDFGKTAGDYAKYRAGFPEAFFERLATMDVIRAGMKALDLGTGTGTVARGMATRGLEVTGLDKSTALMEQAKLLDAEAGVAVRYVEGTAEATGFPGHTFDIVTAGQCWHWFKRAEAAKEVAAHPEAGRAPRHRAFRLDCASRQRRGCDRAPDPFIQRCVESIGRHRDVSTMVARYGRGGLPYKSKALLSIWMCLLA